jgi:hypothetical protein
MQFNVFFNGINVKGLPGMKTSFMLMSDKKGIFNIPRSPNAFAIALYGLIYVWLSNGLHYLMQVLNNA